MSDVAILTFHRACNYGAFLQAYALQEYIKQFPDSSAYILDYRSNDIENRSRAAFALTGKGNPVKKLCKFILDYRDVRKRNRVFEDARNTYFCFKRNTVSKNQLPQEARKYDAVIVGSDQVWNRDIVHQDDSFFLDFVSPPVLKYSYSASIGKATLSEQELQDLCKIIFDYKRVSVREADIVPALQQYPNLPPISCTLDPVFLYEAENWKMFARYKSRRPYVLFFMMGQSSSALPALNFAKKLAKENGLDILFLSDSDRWYKFRDLTHFGAASPSEFVGLIQNAEYVVTNSFHATAFSIILHKRFFVETNVLRSNRILNLLQITGLEQCGLVNGEKIPSASEIDWETVDRNLAPALNESREYLKSILHDLSKKEGQ